MRYTVKEKHRKKNDKTSGPKSVVELAEEEAAPLLHHLELIEDAVGSADGSEDSVEEKKRRKK